MDENQEKRPLGILRLDIGKPRRSSGGSVEFRKQPELLGQASQNSPSTAVSPQLSVTWAFPKRVQGEISSDEQHILQEREIFGRKPSAYSSGFLENPSDVLNAHDSEDDYSVSVSAIMQRRASTKGKRKSFKSSRRTSSPMGHVIGLNSLNDRRRSSVFTTSSGDTAISFDDGTNHDSTQEQIFENIRLHKEVLQSVKLQPWSMRRKLRLVRQAKEYVARHEGALQERFAMSRSTRDLLTRFRIVLATKWQHSKRELANISTVLIPWEGRIKEIESHFGSVVASYFTFLRWLLWVNIVIAVVLGVFVVAPELSVFDPKSTDTRKTMLPEEREIAAKLITIWDFEGFLRYSPIFYGYYSDIAVEKRWGYKLPLAYFLTGLVVYIYSFVATLRKMAENSRSSKLSTKDDECVFTWKLFTGWDFMIGHGETAHNRVASVVLGFKEALLEEAEKKKDKRNWKVITLRVIVNFIVLGLLSISAFAVVWVVNRSTGEGSHSSWWRRNEITIVMSLITFVFPMFFEVLGLLESYHPRQQLRRQLGRIMLLNLLNLYSLIFALFDKISDMNREMTEIRTNLESSEIEFLKQLNYSVYTTSTTTTTVPTAIIETYSEFFTTPTFVETTTLSDLTTQWVNDLVTNFFDTNGTTSNSDIITVPNNGCISVPVKCETQTNANETVIFTLSLLKLMSDQILKNYKKNKNVVSKYDPTNDDNISDTTEWPMLNATDFNYYNFNTTFNFLEDNDTLHDNQTKTKYRRSKREDLIEVVTIYEPNINQLDDFEFSDYLSKLYSDYDDGVSNISNTSFPTENITDIIETTVSTIVEDLTESSTISDESSFSKSENLKNKFKELFNYVIAKIPIVNENEEICYNITCPQEIEEYGWMKSTTGDDLMETPTQEYVTKTIKNENQTTTAPISSNQTDLIVSNYKISMENLTATSVDSSSTALIAGSEILNTTYANYTLNLQKRLRKLCWETMFGQELVKLTVMDLLVTVLSILMIDFFRALFVRFMNKFWCWDLEKNFPKYGDFKIAENILHLVNNQGMVWMGMFFSPGLAILNLIKLVIILYMRSWAVLTCNVPHEVVFRASRSNNFYLALLLTMLFLCVLPVAFAIVWLRPSWHCGPFANNERIYHLFTKTLKEALPDTLNNSLNYIASPSTVIPLLVLLVLIIYYLISLTNSLREANQDLKVQLQRERTEERRKMFRIVENNPSGDLPNTISARWKKVLENSTSPLTPTGTNFPEFDETKAQARKELLARIMKKALRKSSTSEDDGHFIHGDDGTDTEQHDSLPHDKEHREDKSKRNKMRSAHESIDSNNSKQVTSWLELVKSASQKEKESKGHSTSPPPYQSDAVITEADNRKNESKLDKFHEKQNSKHIEFASINPPEYSVINEKLQQTGSKEPEVFKFDEMLELLEKEREMKKQKEKEQELKEEDDEYLSDDMSSYREINFTPMNKVDEKSPKDSPSSETKHDSNLKTEIKKNKDINKEIGTKGMKKLNSFFTLVREAVQNYRTESIENSPDGQTTEFSLPRAERSNSFQKIVRLATRQNSVSSINPESIPVIMISKTESDECILDNDKASKKNKTKSTGERKTNDKKGHAKKKSN